MRVNARVTGVGRALAVMGIAERLTLEAAKVGLGRAAQAGVGIVRGNASGRPGPRFITGDYRRSWSADTDTNGGNIQAQIGTNAAQGRRLEYGFTGTDILGRSYDQPPFPHVKPAADKLIPIVEAEVGGSIKKAL